MATAPPSRHAPRGSPAGGVAMAAGALGALVAALESYRGRDRVVSAAGGRAEQAVRPCGPMALPSPGRSPQVRALCYGCQLAGGALAGTQSPAEGLPGSLLAVSAQLSSCRTVLRLLDDFAMLSHSRAYGLGPKVSAGRGARREEAVRPQASGCARVLPAGRGRAGARAVGALQRGRPALLPLRARRLGGRHRRHPRPLPALVGRQHGALGALAAAGHPAVSGGPGKGPSAPIPTAALQK